MKFLKKIKGICKLKKLKIFSVPIAVTVILAVVLFFLLLRHIIVVSCFSDDQGIEIPIVMYHNISKKQALLGKYAVSEAQFKRDLEYIRSKGYNTITMTELIEFAYEDEPLPEKPIIITFDDGYESFYAYVFPLLKEYNMKAVVSIVGAYTDLFTEEDDHNVDYSYLTWEEVNEMSDSGLVEIQNHTYDMHRISKDRKGCGKIKGESIEKYSDELNEDLGKLQQEILMYTGISPNTFTYPYGYISPESGDIIKNMGFKAALTCYEVVNKPEEGTDWLYKLGRFNRESGKSSEEFFRKMQKNNK